MKYVLTLSRIAADGRVSQVRFSLDKRGVTAGRDSEQIQLDDPQVSRQHALFFPKKDGSLWVKDLQSSNGTFVNGVKVEEFRLRPGVSVRLGATELEVLSFRPLEGYASVSAPRPGDPITGMTELVDAEEESSGKQLAYFRFAPRKTRSGV